MGATLAPILYVNLTVSARVFFSGYPGQMQTALAAWGS
jgi:hypothetical protein